MNKNVDWEMYRNRIDRTTLEGEVPEAEEEILNKLFTSHSSPITDLDLQKRGVDYQCVTKDGRTVNVDFKHDHFNSKGDFIYETKDCFGHSWTTQDFHITDYIIWVKHSQGEAYLIDFHKLGEVSQKGYFKERHIYPMGNNTFGKFLRLFSEVPVEEACNFKKDPKVPIRYSMKDSKKYITDLEFSRLNEKVEERDNSMPEGVIG